MFNTRVLSFITIAAVALSGVIATPGGIGAAECCTPICSAAGCYCQDGTPGTPYCGNGEWCAFHPSTDIRVSISDLLVTFLDAIAMEDVVTRGSLLISESYSSQVKHT